MLNVIQIITLRETFITRITEKNNFSIHVNFSNPVTEEINENIKDSFNMYNVMYLKHFLHFVNSPKTSAFPAMTTANSAFPNIINGSMLFFKWQVFTVQSIACVIYLIIISAISNLVQSFIDINYTSYL